MSAGSMVTVGSAIAFLELNTDNYANSLQTAQRQMHAFADNTNGVTDRMSSLSDGLNTVGKTMTLGVTAPLAGIGAMAVKTSIDLESAFAGVEKTVDNSKEGFAIMRAELNELASTSVPMAVEGLYGIAESAGQLGISTDNIVSFTETMAQLSVSTNMTAEETATSFARLGNIMQMSEENYDRLGSVVVDLGNNLATTESEITAMGLRLAGTGQQIGLSEAQVLSFAGAMSSVGIQAEAGGSSMSRVWQKINTDVAGGGVALDNFAKVSGMSANEFAEAWKTRPAEATTAFVKGLQGIKESGGDVTSVLKNLGISSSQEIDTLLRLSGASDVLVESLEIGNKAWEENTALTDEASKHAETTAAQIQILKNNLVLAGDSIGQVLLPMLNGLIQFMIPVIKTFSGLSDGVKGAIIALGILAATIGPTMLLIATMIGTVTKLNQAWIWYKGTQGLAALAMSAWSAATVPATVGTTAFGAAVNFLLAPITLVVLAIGALIVAGGLLYKKFKKTSTDIGKDASKATDEVSDLEKRISDITKGIDIDVPKNDFENAGAEMNKAIADGLDKTADKPDKSLKKMQDKMVKDMEKTAAKLKETISKDSSDLDKFGEAIVTALKNKYTQMEKVQTAYISNNIESEKNHLSKQIQMIEQGAESERKALGERIESLKKSSSERIKVMESTSREQIKFLEDDLKNTKKTSDEQIKDMERVQKHEAKVLDDRLKELRSVTDARIKEYDKEYAEQLKVIDREAYEKTQALQAQIDAIDSMTEQENKAREKRDHDRQVAELKSRIQQAEDAEERVRLQQEMEKTLADWQRKQLLEERDLKKEELKNQISQVKEALDEQREVMKLEVEDKKIIEKQKLEAQTEAIGLSKELMKEELESFKENETLRIEALSEYTAKSKEFIQQDVADRKEAEQLKLQASTEAIQFQIEQNNQVAEARIESEKQRSQSIIENLELERDRTKEHYSNLMEQENLSAEARKMAIQGNNNEIIALLGTYNPKWQDAGQSFADSMINGLNSQNEPMQAAIGRALNLAPVIRANQAELESLEQSIEAIKEKDENLLPKTEQGFNDGAEAMQKSNDVMKDTQAELNKTDKSLKENEEAGGRWSKAWSRAWANTKRDWEDTKQGWRESWKTLGEVTYSGIATILKPFEGIGKGIYDGIMSGADWINRGIARVEKWINEGWENLGNDSFITGENIVDGLIQGIYAKFPMLERVAGLIGNVITWGTRNELDTHSPSRVFERIGSDTIDGLELGMLNSLPHIVKASEKLAQATQVDYSQQEKFIAPQVTSQNAQSQTEINELINVLSKMQQTDTSQGNGSQPIILKIGQTEFARATVDSLREYQKQTGNMILT